MRKRAAELRALREAERAAEAERLLKARLFAEDAGLREQERELATAALSRRREEQVEDSVDKQLRLAEENAAVEAAISAAARRRAAEADAVQAANRREDALHGEALQRQMQELAERDREASELRQENERLQAELTARQQEQDRRASDQRRASAVRHGRQLQRQHKALLARRSAEVESQLAADLELLEAIAQAEATEEAVKTERREAARADIEWMRGEVAHQLELERARSTAIDALYNEEAQRMWAKQDLVWERERQARERLMQQVLAEREQQVAERLEVVRQKQLDSVTAREELLRVIDREQQATARDEAEAAAATARRRDELAEQLATDRALEAARRDEEHIRQLRERQAAERAAALVDEERRRRADEAREEENMTSRIRAEMRSARSSRPATAAVGPPSTRPPSRDYAYSVNFGPPKHGRKKIAWD